MAKYPIKMLKDEEGTPFVPLVSTEALRTPEGETIEEKLEKKLEVSNIKAGTDISLSIDGNNITINNASKGVLIDNLDTETSGLGSLDARQGKVLKDMIPDVVNNLTTVSTDKALSAYQGYLLNHRVVPTGGTTGQVLKKSSNDDHALEWGDAADPNAIVGDGSIKKIVELTYEEYQALKTIDPDTEYHILDAQSAIDELQATLDSLQTQITTLKNSLKSVAFSNSYNDLNNLPSLFSGNYNDLSNKPFDIGSNDNGNYIKYIDGTLICYKKVSFSDLVVNGAWGQLYESTAVSLGNWPIAFIEAPITSVTPVSNNGMFLQGHNAVTSTSAGSVWLTRGASSPGVSGYISVIGFGRWK